MKKAILGLIFLIPVVVISSYAFSDRPLLNAIEEDARQKGEDMTPATKIPPISLSVSMLLQYLTERVWVSKYYGMPSEIFGFGSPMPFCSEWSDKEKEYLHRNGKNKDSILWMHKCTPVEIQAQKTNEDLSGVIVVRMLDFNVSTEILQEVFDIIKADSLGSYEIDKNKKEVIRQIVENKLGPRDRYSPINYGNKIRTYSKLEEYYFAENADLQYADGTEAPELTVINNYFTNRGKKHTLSLVFNPENYKKEGNIVEFTLTAPVGFFGFGNEKE